MTLDELQKLCDEATPGPWDRETYYCRMDASFKHAETPDTRNHKQAEIDANFIAASRTYLPLLLAVARAAEKTKCGNSNESKTLVLALAALRDA